MKIIDAHAHLGPWDPDYMSADMEEFLKLQSESGISISIVSSTEAINNSSTVSGNEYIIKCSEGTKRLLVWLVLNPLDMTESGKLLKRFHNHQKVVGVKLHPVRHKYGLLIQPVYDLLTQIESYKLPVLTHCQDNVEGNQGDDVRQLAERFAKINFVAAHFGIANFGSGYKVLDFMTKGLKNLYIDTASLRVFTRGYLGFVLKHIGDRHILFGTDMPLYDPRPFVNMLNVVDIPEQSRLRLVFENARDLLNIGI